MRSVKNIVWLSPGFASSENDDATIPTIQKLALEYKKHSPEINLRIVSIHFPFQTEEYKWNTIPVHPIGGKNSSFPFRFLVWKKVLKKLKVLHQQTKIDLVHSFWLNEPALLANRFCKKNNIPHVCTMIGQSTRSSNRYLKYLPLNSFYKVAESLRGAELLKRNTGTSADEVIAWGIDEMNIEVTNKRTIDIIGVGSLTPVKNYSLFIEILAKVKSNKNFKACLIGDGPEMKMLKELTKNYGIENNISFTGWLSRHEVIKLMSQSKILLHTSGFEGFGFIFPEAAACGCFIVSTPVGAIDNNDFSFVSSEAGEMAKKICTIMETVETFSPRQVRTMKETSEKYIELYSRLINRKH